MIVYKHHVSKHFKKGISRNNGVGEGGTVFLDFNKMKDYLRADGRKWSIAILNMNKEDLHFNMGNEYMATSKISKSCKKGFEPIEL